MKKIAILGATSHIAKGLIWSFLSNTDHVLFLFARDSVSVHNFLHDNHLDNAGCLISGFENFGIDEFDVIINCVGIADPKKQKEAGSNIFFITETYDNMVLNYLTVHSDSVYINFSSGAVYGTSFSEPVNSESSALVKVNDIKPVDYYRIAKLNSEAKHRASCELKIIDLRVFSYFSRFVDLNTSFLMTDIVNAILKKQVLHTSTTDITRDYLSPEDLFRLIQLVMLKPLNCAVDCASSLSVTKFEILNVFKNKFGLEFVMDISQAVMNSTGLKNIYYSESKNAEIFGFHPEDSSIDTLAREMNYILSAALKR